MMALQIKDLKARLSNKLIVLDGGIDKVGQALLKQKSIIRALLDNFSCWELTDVEGQN